MSRKFTQKPAQETRPGAALKEHRAVLPLGKLATLLVAALAAAYGCAALAPSSVTPVGEIIESPRDYDGELVRVRGTVQAPFSLLLVKFFELRDPTGAIPVITRRPMPREGARITVVGRVNASFSIGVVNMVVIEERE